MNYSYFKDDFDSMMHFVGEKIAGGMPVCVLRLPDRDIFTQNFIVHVPLFADDIEHRMVARVKPWLSSDWYDFSTTVNGPVQPMPVCPESTSEADYTASIAELVKILEKRKGKTVICRNICGKFRNFDLRDIFSRYLDKADRSNSVTFLLWHPDMNFWMGSTPELILERCHNGTYHTIALAGTRHNRISGEWDMKNIAEHNLVVDDIEKRLSLTGLKFYRMPIRELSYGQINHLVTNFVSDFVENGHDRLFFDSVADEIQPTPALAGYPRACAISEIERFEKWPRYLYAGCLNIADVRLNMTYGMIRCVHFDNEKWAIYTGSGITSDSLPYTEWKETEIKAAPLVACLSDFS